MSDMELEKRLRDTAWKLRTFPAPRVEIIPLLQQAADALSAKEAECKALREKLDIAKAAIKAMAEDGWLYHGVEGMSESQDLCYEAYLKLGLKELPDSLLRSRKYVDAMREAIGQFVAEFNVSSVGGPILNDAVARLEQSLNPKNEEG